eukprot:7231527-Pyramimonas_sp.AAC.1
MEQELKETGALLAATRKANISQAPSDYDMEIVGAAEPSKDDNFIKRTAFQEKINIHERTLKDLSSLGQEDGEMAKLARAELDKLREK